MEAQRPQGIVKSSLLTGLSLTTMSFVSGLYLSRRSGAALRTGPQPGLLDLLVNNLGLAMLIAAGLVTSGLLTIAVGSWSMFVTGASFGAALNSYGLADVLTSSPHLGFELAGFVIASSIGLSPLSVAMARLQGRPVTPRHRRLKVTAMAFVLMILLLVAGALVEYSVSYELAGQVSR